MKDPKIKVKIKHSETKPAWNIVGDTLGGKYKICRVPYVATEIAEIDVRNRKEAYEHAEFIAWCFNYSTAIENCIPTIVEEARKAKANK